MPTKGFLFIYFIGKERDHIWTRNGSLKSGVNTEKMKLILKCGKSVWADPRLSHSPIFILYSTSVGSGNYPPVN